MLKSVFPAHALFGQRIRKLIVGGALAASLVTACTTSPQVATTESAKAEARRNIASLDEGDVNLLITDLNSAADPRQFVDDRMKVLTDEYAFSESLKSKLDTRLGELVKQKESTPDADIHLLDVESKLYSQLLAMRSLRHETEQKIVDLLSALISTKYNFGNLYQEKLRLSPVQTQLALDEFYKNLKDPSDVNRLALHDLKRKVDTTHTLFKTLFSAEDVFANFGFNEAEVIGKLESEHELAGLSSHPTLKAELRHRVRSIDLKNGAIAEAINTNAPMIEQFLKDMKERRAPQSQALDIHPSNGPDGNITGLSFPRNVWALTFDDGPHPTYTAKILENLKDTHTPATFFELAQNSKITSAIAAVVASGDTTLPHPNALANHSFTHPQVNKLGPKPMHHEISDAEDVLQQNWNSALVAYHLGNKTADVRTDLHAKFFRLPYGAGVQNKAVRDMLTSLGLIHVLWNVDSLDWQDHNSTSVYNRVLRQMKLEGRGVILFHDIHEQTIVASKMVMDYMNAQKFRTVTLPEIVNELNCPSAPANPCPAAWRATNW